MNLKKLFLMLTFFVLLGTTAFAQTYVSNTNGNDIVGTGTALAPYKTIAVGITNTSAGGTVMIDADTYNEANVSITKSLTLVSRTFNALNTVTITNGVTINGAAITVNLGTTASGSVQFNLGSTNTALVLTAGALNITQANVTIASGGRITRSGGTINEGPTTTNVNVFYSGATSLVAGPELPASLGTGSLNVNMGAAATAVTVGGNLALSSGQIVVVQGSPSFNGTVSFTSDGPNATGVDNQGAGTVTFANAITGARATAGAAQTTVLTNAAGVLTLTGGVTGTSTFTFGLLNGAGTINVGPGTYAGTVNNNTAAGTLNLLSAVTFSNNTVSNGNATAVIKLNGFQLTLSGAGVTLTNTGNLISATATTVGSGMLNITGIVTTTGTGELPNVTVGSGGKLTLGAATSVYGDFTLNSAVAGALTDGGFALSILGTSFNRTNNTPGNYTATGTLTFASATAQQLNPGGSLVLNNLTINKGSAAVLTLTASVEAAGNFTITAGSLDLGNFNLNLSGASVFTNGGSAYSTTGVGYVVFMGASGSVTGAGTFGNILVNLSNAANTVATGSSINFSGTLYINQGQFHVANGHTVTFNNTLVANPTIKINTTAANTAGLTKVTAGGTGALTFSANVNLEYVGNAAYNVNTLALGANSAGQEWVQQPLKLNNVTVSNAAVLTGFAGASTIAGTLSVAASTTLAQGAFVYTLSGDSKTHSIIGSVTGGTLTVTGTGSAVNGVSGTTAAQTATVNNLFFEPIANGASFSSTNLKVISGNLTLQGVSTFTSATATVAMNTTVGTLTGNLTVGNATLGPVASVTINGSTTSVLTGNVVLTNGTLTLTRGGNSTVIGGAVTLTAGTFNMGSNLSATGATTHVAANINAGGFKYTQLGSGASPDYNRTGAGTFTNGTLALVSTAAAIDLTPGATFTVPNMEVTGTANGVTLNASMTVSGNLTIDNAGTLTQGAGTLSVGGNTTIGATAGAAGAFTGAIEFTGASATITLYQAYTFPTMTVNSAGTVTVASNNTTARTLSTSTAFTNTAGTLAMGINHLTIGAGTFTFTAGAITQGTGILTFNTAGAITLPASGFSIDNLTVSTAFTAGTSAFTVVKALIVSGTVTTSATGKLTLGDGCLVTRTANAATLSQIPTFGANTDLKYQTYTGAADIVAAKELPATVRNLTVVSSDATATNVDGFEVILNANVTVTGTLSLADLLDATTNTKVVTMADGSTLELKVNGNVALDQNLTKAGAMNLVYNGATATTVRELGAVTSGAYAAYAGAVTVKSLVALTGGTLVANGAFTFDGGNFDLNGLALGIGGSVTTTSNGGVFVNGGAAKALSLVGATNTTFGLGATWSLPAAIVLTLNKTNATNTVTLTGGDLDFATNSATLGFANGVLVTGTNNVILKHTNAGGQPSQGFTRAGVTGTNVSHVNGNVKKLLTIVGNANAAVDLTRVEFPVGNTTNYRPMAFQFNTLPTSNVNLTVSENEGSPLGTNGFPLTSGSLTITNYPNFSWLVKSDVTLQPQVKYDIEAIAAGYTDYQTDGIQNIRFIRRFDGNVANPWIVQGGSGYDNSTSGTNPVVIVRGAEGAISTQGALFTYSQLNKAPVVSAPADVTVAENAAATVTWTKSDPDIGQTPTFTGVAWTATAPAVVPTNATFNATTGVLTWTPTYSQAGVYTVTVTATDGVLTTTDVVTITVTDVPRPPVFSAASGTTNPATVTASNGVASAMTFLATDADGDVVTYSYTVLPAVSANSVVFSTTTGALTFTPVYADVANSPFTFTVTASSGTPVATATMTTVVTVGRSAVKGDVNLSSGTITSADALLVLNYVVNPTVYPLTAEQQWAADVNNDGVVGAYDAASILVKAGGGAFLPKQVAASGTVEFGSFTSEKGVFTLPINVENTAGVKSFYSEIQLGNSVEFTGMNSRLPEGWVMASHFENGLLKIAMAGTTPLTTGSVAFVNLSLNDKEASVNIQGSTILNDQIAGALNAVKIREIPSEFSLSQNYPNPFNPITSIKYAISENARVNLVVYNILGQAVKTLVNAEQESGYYTVRWDGTNDFGGKVSSGIYIYRISAGKFTSTVKMNLLK